jgi:hypothetical protein
MSQKPTRPGLGDTTTAGGETLVDAKIALTDTPTMAPGSGVMVVPPKQRLAYGTDPGLALHGGAEQVLVRGLGKAGEEEPASLPAVTSLLRSDAPADAPTHLRFATDPRLASVGGETRDLVAGLGKGREGQAVLPDVEALSPRFEAPTVPRAAKPEPSARQAAPRTAGAHESKGVSSTPPPNVRASTTDARLRFASVSLGKYAIAVVVVTIFLMIFLRLAFGPKDVPGGAPSPAGTLEPAPRETAAVTAVVSAPLPPSASAPVPTAPTSAVPATSASGSAKSAPPKPQASHEPKPAGPATSHTTEPPPKPSATIAPDLQGTF